MASKAIYTVVAVAGIAVASGAAWWYQKPKANDASGASSQATGASPAATGPSDGRPLSVEFAKVEVTKITDDTQAVGSLRSRRGVILRPEVSGRITRLNFTDGQRVRKGQV
ncbi:MAG: biotin/lipoyl-binding protein, partial [Stagnimonas sp.]|nr:biotin/lipoyl-binding protein [Stagnimonas sp.]